MPHTNERKDKQAMKRFGLPFSALRLKRKTTVSDILTQDDVLSVLEDLANNKERIKDLIVIYTDSKGTYHWNVTGGTLSSTAIWMLEGVKLDVLDGDK
jgi:hypothetical protein